ncbi:MAG: hypothetical protein C0501_30380 [Isosphaera sp.]|nr:hypothetical protein [Isosphaera sp.]
MDTATTPADPVPTAGVTDPPALSAVMVRDATYGVHQVRLFTPDGDGRSADAMRRLVADAAGGCRRELQAVRDAFFADGPGRELRDAEARLAVARVELAAARQERGRLGDGWQAAVESDDSDEVVRLEELADAADRTVTRLKARLPALEAKVGKLREEVGPRLHAMVAGRLAAFVAEADRAKADALGRILAAVSGPFLDWLRAFAGRDGAVALEQPGGKPFRSLVSLDGPHPKATPDPPAPEPARAFAFDRGTEFPERRAAGPAAGRNPFLPAAD